MAVPLDNGQHRGHRESNFWKKKETIANQVDSFKESNPTLFGQPIDMPAIETTQETQPADQSSQSLNLQESYAASNPQPSNPQSYNIQDIMLQKASAGEAPQYDEAQKKRLQKQARMAAIAQGIQGIAGAIGLAGGYDIPQIDQNVIGADAINRLNQLDARYFEDLARHRDAELRANFYNTGAANDAEMAKWRARQEAIAAGENREFQVEQSEKVREFTAEENAKDRALRKKGYDLDVQRISNYNSAQKMEALKRYEELYDDLEAEYKIAIDNFDDKKAAELSKQMIDNRKLRAELSNQLAVREGFDMPQSNQAKQQPSPWVEGMQEWQKMGGGQPKTQGKQEPQSNQAKQQPPKEMSKQEETRQAYNSMISDAIKNGQLTSAQLKVLFNTGVDPERTIKILQQNGVKLPDNPAPNSNSGGSRVTEYRW